jgi:hypothetical protein
MNAELLTSFANAHRLKLTHDACDELVARCKEKDSNISEFSDTELAMCWIPDGRKAARTGSGNRVKSECLAAGMTLHQEGDAEGILTFDPESLEQAKLAIKGVKANVKRRMTPERRNALAKALILARKHCEESRSEG